VESVEIREYLVLRFDGTTVRFPVRDGDVAQARLRAALTQRPDDRVVAVTDDAYIRVGSDPGSDDRFIVGGSQSPPPLDARVA
jgi:hypothetical protein